MPFVERRRVNRRVYVWAALAVAFIVAALLGGLLLLEAQTTRLEHDTRGAVCISLAHQQVIAAQLPGSPRLPDIQALCNGQSIEQILAAGARGDLRGAAGY